MLIWVLGLIHLGQQVVNQIYKCDLMDLVAKLYLLFKELYILLLVIV